MPPLPGNSDYVLFLFFLMYIECLCTCIQVATEATRGHQNSRARVAGAGELHDVGAGN